MKTRKYILVTLTCFLFLMSCGGNQVEVSKQEATIKEFLNIYWTQNYEGRYQQMNEGLKNENDPTALQDVVASYYESVEGYVTEEKLEALMANRVPYKYEELAEQCGASYSIQDIQLEEVEAGIYDYEVTLLWKMEEDKVKVSVSGEIHVINENENCKIDYFYESRVFPELEW